MRAPLLIERLLCRLGVHSWNRPRRVKSLKIRRCASCHLRQVEGASGNWITTTPVKRPRRKKESAAQAIGAIRQDGEGGSGLP